MSAHHGPERPCAGAQSLFVYSNVMNKPKENFRVLAAGGRAGLGCCGLGLGWGSTILEPFGI